MHSTILAESIFYDLFPKPPYKKYKEKPLGNATRFLSSKSIAKTMLVLFVFLFVGKIVKNAFNYFFEYMLFVYSR